MGNSQQCLTHLLIYKLFYLIIRFYRGLPASASARDGPELRCGESRMSHEDQVRRANLLQEDNPADRLGSLKDRHKFFGCKGRSILSLILPYISLATVFLVPIAHCLLYGVVASFVGHILRPITKPGKVRTYIHSIYTHPYIRSKT